MPCDAYSTTFISEIPAGFMNIIRKFLHELLSLYFGVGEVPKSFAQIAAGPHKHIVVTPGSSMVFDCIINSFARRSGLKGARHCSSLCAQAGSIAELQPEFVYWLSLDEEHLIDRIYRARPQLLFSTLNTFRMRGPVRSHPNVRMSRWRQAGLILGFRFLIVIFGKPLDLSGVATSHARQIVRRLKVNFFQNLKLVRGMPFQAMETQVRAILAGNEYQRELRIIAARVNCSESEAHQRARRAFFELAANPIAPMYLLARPVCRFLIRRLFSQVVTVGLDRLSAAVQNHTVVMVPMHRSHLDYLLLGYELYQANLNPPIVAAGINLSFWPFGFIIRSLGGYFVKRDARHDRLHALVLKRYVAYLIKRGHMQEFFIEGGRSRSGRMVHPKLGILSTIIGAYRQGFRKDVLFVPVSITYERVVEDSAFGEENTGRSKKQENLISLLKAWRIFRCKYGEVILKFGEPVSLRAFSLQRTASGSSGEERPIASNLAQVLTAAVQNQSDMSLASLAACALMLSPSYGRLRRDLAGDIRSLARLAGLVSDACSFSPGRTSPLEAFLAGREEALDDLAKCGFIARSSIHNSDVFFIPGERRFMADFYRNASFHIFLPPSLLALCELLHGEVRPEDLAAWHEILAYPFQLPSREAFLDSMRRLIEKLSTEGLLCYRDGRTIFSSRQDGLFIPTMLQSSLESLLWIYRNLHSAMETVENPEESAPAQQPALSCSHNHLLERLINDYKTACYLGGFSRTEAASRSSLTLFLDSLKARRVLAFDDKPSAGSRIVLLRDDSQCARLVLRAAEACNHWLSEKRIFNGE